MDHDLIQKYGVRKGGYLEVMVSYHDGHYWSGGDQWKKIENFLKEF